MPGLELNIPVMWHLENILLIFHNVRIQLFAKQTLEFNNNTVYNTSGRRGGLTGLVRWTPDREVRLRALSGVIALCSWAKYFTLTVHLSIHEYKWVPANCQGNLTKCWGLPAMD